MEKSVTRAGRRAVTALLLLAWMGMLGGCAGFERAVPAENRISFAGKATGEGVFASGPLTVDYGYNLKGQTLQLTGTVYFHGGYDSLNVYALFTDASGAVLQRDIVYYSGYRVGFWSAGRTFRTNLDPPGGAADFSFSYSAQPVSIKR